MSKSMVFVSLEDGLEKPSKMIEKRQTVEENFIFSSYFILRTMEENDTFFLTFRTIIKILGETSNGQVSTIFNSSSI